MNRQHEIDQLLAGFTVGFRPVGNSMTPRIKSKQLVTFSPDVSNVEVGDVVLCKVNGVIMCHLVTAIQGDRYQISNNHGHVNGWTKKVYGKVITIED
jgi:hypothetical protein